MTQEEYNTVVRQWADAAYRFAVRCGGSEEESKDAVQEAFAVLWEHRGRVEAAKGRAFVLTVVHNYLMSRYRHEQVRQQAVADLRSDEMVRPDERFDLQTALHLALQRLPEVQRAAIELKDVEGYSCKEIGEILGLSESQVRVYLFRARVSMKKSLIALGYDNND